jgi:hypothetical protein
VPNTQSDGGFVLVGYKTGKVRYFYEENIHSLEEAHDFSRWKNYNPSFPITENGGVIVAFVALPYISSGEGTPAFAILKTLLLHDDSCVLSGLLDSLANKAREHKPAQ